MRYATYNGSDARTAPATLGCISHVELALGGYGVRGGMAELPRALARAAEKAGAKIVTDAKVEQILVEERSVQGVRLDGGTVFAASQVVMNGDVAALFDGLLLDAPTLPEGVPSMSAYCGVYRAKEPLRSGTRRAAHTVLFPEGYEREFEDIFDLETVPREPTIYLCAQKMCHERAAWEIHEPVFFMVNAPPISAGFDGEDRPQLREDIKSRLVQKRLLDPEDTLEWWRTPKELAQRFPGSRGALYGAASNSATAAFKRPPNRVAQVQGLYLASGSAHPGGGLPMVAQSGKLAAHAAADDRRREFAR